MESWRLKSQSFFLTCFFFFFRFKRYVMSDMMMTISRRRRICLGGWMDGLWYFLSLCLDRNLKRLGKKRKKEDYMYEYEIDVS